MRSRRVLAWLVAGLPDEVRHRVFEAAYHDLRDEQRERAAGSPRLARPLLHLLAASQVLQLVVSSYRFSTAQAIRRARRAPQEPRRRWPRVVVAQEVRQALRLFRKQPGFTLVAVLTLALGIGGTTALFSTVDAVLLRPLPYPEADRLVDVTETLNANPTAVSPVNFFDWQASSHSFERMALYSDATTTLTGRGEAEQLVSCEIAANLFPTLRVPPAAGRNFRAEEDRAGQPHVAIIGDALWKRRFGADPNVVGATVRFDSEPYEIVGVMPPGFAFPQGTEVWFPLAMSPRQIAATARGAHYMSAVARLQRGASVARAQAEMDGIAARLARENPRTNEGGGVRVLALLDSLVGDARPALLVLLGAVGCVLLIGCANVSNLLLARAVGRQSEIAVRAALGAGRLALLRQLLTESLLLSALAGLAGLLIAAWAVSGIAASLPADVPRLAAVRLDAHALAFTFALMLVASVAFGLAPALHGLRTDLRQSLGSRRMSGATIEGNRTRNLLVVAEVALAAMLLVGAGLLVRSFALLSHVNPGFDASQVATIDVALPSARYPRPFQVVRFFDALVGKVAAHPGVQAAGGVMIPPLVGVGYGGTFTIEGRPAVTGINEPRAQVRPISGEYFRAMRIPVIRGRRFTDTDGAPDAPVVIVSETAVRRYWTGENPIGKRVRIHVHMGPDPEPFREIVGVVADVKGGSLDKPPAPVFYVPHAQFPSAWMTVVARTSSPVGPSLAILAGAVREIDREVAATPKPLQDRVGAAVAAPRSRTLLLSLFALVALGLAAVGLYGVVACGVTRRTHEIGVRLALGAQRSDVIRQIVREGMAPVVVGLALGAAGAVALTRLVQGMLFGVGSHDPATFVSTLALLFVTALAACYLPARRATRVDPLATLRTE